MAGKDLHAERPVCTKFLWLEGTWCLLGTEMSPGLLELNVTKTMREMDRRRSQTPRGTVLEDHAKHILTDPKAEKPQECATQRGDLN